MTEHDQGPPETAEELLREDLESARKLLERKKKDRSQGALQRPLRADPRYTDQSVAPGRTDIPAGGTSGGDIGGTSKHRR